jgi:hypothetical protein
MPYHSQATRRSREGKTVKTILLVLTTFAAASILAADNGAPIPREEQIRMLRDYMLVTGVHATSGSALAIAEEEAPAQPVKCGMSAVADAVLNRNKFDKDLLMSLGVKELNERPVLPRQYISPSGYFEIHYASTGDSAVYHANIDNNNNGVPDYVESVGIIADSVLHHITDSSALGYPRPPSDSFYAEGGDFRYDVYLLPLGASVYGLAYPDSVSLGLQGIQATSFIKLDNDYHLLADYKNRPLDAVRVTMAHEFFHAVQFGLNITEADGSNYEKRYWMEMSATWMEDEVYPNINDYYGYLPYFFKYPNSSLQQFNGLGDYHPYASVVFPLYLSQRFGAHIIWRIWNSSHLLGLGPHFWPVLSAVLDSAYIEANTPNFQAGTGLPRAFREFALWNYFTGSRANLAPNGEGYTDRFNYPIIPDLDTIQAGTIYIERPVIGIYRSYPVVNDPASNQFKPEQNAATYIRFEGLPAFLRRYFVCGKINTDSLCKIRYVDTLRCTDSTEIPLSLVNTACPTNDTLSTCQLRGTCVDDSIYRAVIDSIFTQFTYVGAESQPWGLSIIYQMKNFPDSFVVDSALLQAPDGNSFGFEVLDPNQFCSATFIFTPASVDYLRYSNGLGRTMAWVVQEKIDTSYHLPCGYDSTTVAVKESILDAYPNPAVVSQMGDPQLKFRFRIPTDSTSFPSCPSPTMVVDLFNVAGERVATIAGTADLSIWRESSHKLVWELPWNLKNESGRPVVSGAYLCVARLFCDQARSTLLAEEKTKVAIIR